jgi:hypothetical protein
MSLTPDIDRAHALVEIASLLKKADIIRDRRLRGMEIHVTGWNNERPGDIATVRPQSFCDGVRLEPVTR